MRNNEYMYMKVSYSILLGWTSLRCFRSWLYTSFRQFVSISYFPSVRSFISCHRNFVTVTSFFIISWLNIKIGHFVSINHFVNSHFVIFLKFLKFRNNDFVYKWFRISSSKSSFRIWTLRLIKLINKNYTNHTVV